jgi:hypothetical protein
MNLPGFFYPRKKRNARSQIIYTLLLKVFPSIFTKDRRKIETEFQHILNKQAVLWKPIYFKT